MDGAVEIGWCDICNKPDVQLIRKYYNYDIKCECHSPNHFEIVWHCKDCKPTPPEKTTVCIKPID